MVTVGTRVVATGRTPTCNPSQPKHKGRALLVSAWECTHTPLLTQAISRLMAWTPLTTLLGILLTPNLLLRDTSTLINLKELVFRLLIRLALVATAVMLILKRVSRTLPIPLAITTKTLFP